MSFVVLFKQVSKKNNIRQMSEQTYPITTVGATIFNQDNQLLLIKTHKWNHKYGLPGGKIEVGEASKQALIREVKEETNLDIFDIEFMLAQDVIFSEEFYKPKHFIFLNYRCQTSNSPNDVVLNEEAQSYVWVLPEEALQMDLNHPTKLLIEEVIKFANPQ
ncbi:hydrolase, nudix family, putative [Microscilla marina ATCC 23134]|uniref:Hydrolase, nudix family, putative n=2 Tax=Microscilla marina TaxID=1027 RepID=A1ZFI4_MICM2|nr:hydrolase, nudix family, putative [Microscilla marina ATCC 23134]